MYKYITENYHTFTNIRLRRFTGNKYVGTNATVLRNLYYPWLVISLFATLLFAQTNEVDKIYSFAYQLYQSSQYQPAGLEFYRIINYYPDHPQINTAKLYYARCLFLTHQVKDAFTAYYTLLNSSSSLQLSKDEIIYELALLNFLLTNYDLSINQLTEITPLSPQYNIAIPLLIRNYIYQDNWALAREKLNLYFSQISKDTELYQQLNQVKDKLAANIYQEKKNVFLAGLLSTFIPGLGQVYAGRNLDGLISFLTNTLFIGATISSYQSANYPATVLLTLFGLPFYTGNIYNATVYTENYNRTEKRKLYKELEKTFPQPDLELRYEKVQSLNISLTSPVSVNSFARDSIIFYQRNLSGQRNSRCVYFPNCSEYGKLSLFRYGIVTGSIKTGARLLRCHPYSYKFYLTTKNQRVYDPVE